MLAAFLGSDDFWTAVIGIGGVIVGAAATLWVALYVAKPKRGLVWEEVRNVSLLRSSSLGLLSVAHDGRVLTNPRLVEVSVRNTGRRDVEPSMFSNGNSSLVFEYGSPIVQLVDSFSEPASGGVPETSINGDRLHVHPSLIAEKQKVTFSVLLDGEVAAVNLASAQIAHNPVREAVSGRRSADPLGWFQNVTMALTALLSIVVIILVIWNDGKEPSSDEGPPLVKYTDVTVENCIKWQKDIHKQSVFIRYCVPSPGAKPSMGPAWR